ncbi:hypothetical protein M153_209510003, partial [Pseudoloma neurophilia]
LRNTNQSENFSRKKSPGRKRKLTKRASSVIQNIVNENSFATANIIRGILKDKTGINISKQTLIRDMNRNGIRTYVARKKPTSRKVNITKRYQFSIRYCGIIDSFLRKYYFF